VTLRTPGLRNPPAPREFARFGDNSWVVPPARIYGAEHVDIGAGVVLMEHMEIRAAAPVRLGDGTRFARFCTIWATEGVHIGDEVLTSDYVAVIDCWDQPFSDRATRPAPGAAAPVVIEDGAYLGCGCIIGPGVTIGRGAFVGEGAVVYDDVPPHAVVYGNPERVTRSWTPGAGWQGDMFGASA
jgi:acetyltransferase-like isoleucine patch superfamily enzyme